MIALLISLNSAFAWNHTLKLWHRNEMPLKWYISDYRMTETSLSEEYQLQQIFDSYDNWVDDVACAQLSHSFEGIREGHHAGGQSGSDNLNTFYYDDPKDIQGAGVLAVTYTVSSGLIAFNRDGSTYRYASDSDIVFTKDVDWISSSDLENCSGTPIEAVTTHEIGHQWGMDHSCEENEVTAGLCGDQELLDANMFWSAPSCASFSPEEVFTDDDVEGMTALYGPYATFNASTDTYGGVPLEVCFELSSTSDISEVEWIFGDGQAENVTVDDPEDYTICHTYTEKGQFTINVTIKGQSDTCGEWQYTDRERSMIVACEPPQPGSGFDGLFSTETLEGEGRILQMINQADTTVYGCIDQVSWDVYQGETLVKSVSAWSPKIEFPEDGDYKIVLSLGGPGGETVDELTVSVSNSPKGGCAAVSGGGMLAGFIGLIGVALRRRREQ